MLSALSLAVLLVAAGVQRSDAAAPAACTATPGCNLSQCPCYHKQIDNGPYARPAGCIGMVRCPVLLPTYTLMLCIQAGQLQAVFARSAVGCRRRKAV